MGSAPRARPASGISCILAGVEGPLPCAALEGHSASLGRDLGEHLWCIQWGWGQHVVDPLEPQEVETCGRASGCCVRKGGGSAARVPSSRGTRWDCRPRVLGVGPAVLRTHGSLVVKKSRLVGGKQWCEVGSAWGFCSSGAGRGCPIGDRAPQLRTFTSAGGWGQGQWPCWAGTQAPGRTARVQLCVQEPRPGQSSTLGPLLGAGLYVGHSRGGDMADASSAQLSGEVLPGCQ